MKAKSIGLIELPNLADAVEAIDVMLKAAEVKFLTWEKNLGGRLVTCVIQGEVSAVTAAVEAAATYSIKKPVATAIIANPHEEIVRVVNQSASRLQL